MSKTAQFCPECGGKLEDGSICEKCGHDINKPDENKTTKPKTDAKAQDPADNPVWKFFEPYLPKLGKYVWILVLIAGIFYVLGGLISLLFLSSGIWNIISGVVAIVIAVIYVKPKFGPALMGEKYEELLNDTIPLGSIRIPMMLIMGVLLEIFGSGWLGVLLLIPAIVLLFFSPFIPYDWNKQ